MTLVLGECSLGGLGVVGDLLASHRKTTSFVLLSTGSMPSPADPFRRFTG